VLHDLPDPAQERLGLVGGVRVLGHDAVDDAVA
jgi:hypothetical protein